MLENYKLPLHANETQFGTVNIYVDFYMFTLQQKQIPSATSIQSMTESSKQYFNFLKASNSTQSILKRDKGSN